jgi:protein involved in polysaccharide export with SLBB domain
VLRDSGIEIYLDEVMGTSGGIPVEIPVRGGDMVIIPESGKVNVEGEVSKPGTYDLPQQMTLLSALAASGGITYSAKVDEVEVIRDVGGSEKARLVVDITKIGTGEERDVRLRNGDIVRIPSDGGRRLTQDTFDGLSRIINVGVGGSFNLAP